MKISQMVSLINLPKIDSLIVFNGKHNVPAKQLKTKDIFYANKAWRITAFSYSCLERKETFVVCLNDKQEISTFPIDNKTISIATSYQL